MADSSHDLLPGFAWAVIRAFLGPLGTCRFEEGDLLYDSPSAYSLTWGEALPVINGAIQVVSPARVASSRLDKDEDSIFYDNWRQGAVVRVTEYPSGSTRTVSTTQGRLYTAVWHGDLSILLATQAEPPLPLLAQDLKPHLAMAANSILARGSAGMTEPCAFAMPYDETSDLLGAKHRKVEAGLSREFKSHAHLVSPSELGVPRAAMFVPTARVAAFVMSAQRAAVEATLKQILYVPSKDRKTDTDRFRLETHGCLLGRTGAEPT